MGGVGSVSPFPRISRRREALALHPEAGRNGYGSKKSENEDVTDVTEENQALTGLRVGRRRDGRCRSMREMADRRTGKVVRE